MAQKLHNPQAAIGLPGESRLKLTAALGTVFAALCAIPAASQAQGSSLLFDTSLTSGCQKVKGSGDFSYTGYSSTPSKDVDGLLPIGARVCADTKTIAGTPARVSPSGKNLG